jgi:type IV secretory pathway VirB2 component (pilin)
MDAAMRLRLHRPSPAHRGAGTLFPADSERSSAETLLGASHPLVTLLRELETVYTQLVAVSAVQATGLVFLLGNHTFGLALALAAIVVQLALVFRAALLRVSRREVCLQLIVEGYRGLRLACVERECRRLRDPRTAKQLARSIAEMIRTATGPVPRAAAARPLFDVRVIRSVAPELRQVAALLQDDCPPLPGVAAVERLVTGPSTPLYGAEVEPLRLELRRARYLLSVNR